MAGMQCECAIHQRCFTQNSISFGHFVGLFTLLSLPCQAVPGPRPIRVPARPRGPGGRRDRRPAYFGAAHGRGLLRRGEREADQAEVAAHRALPHQPRVRHRHRVAGGGTDVSNRPCARGEADRDVLSVLVPGLIKNKNMRFSSLVAYVTRT